MVTTRRARRKRRRRRLTARSQPDDEVDDADFVNYAWGLLTGFSLILLVISVLLGVVSSSVGDVFRVLYALSCLILFAGTTSYVGQSVSQDIKDSRLNLHITRKQTFREAVRGAGSWVLLIWVLYVPGVIIPAFVFREEWLAYLALLIAAATLLHGGYVVFRWWWYHTVKSE